MKFKCMNCKAVHRSVLGPKDPTSRLFGTKWFRDQSGLDHFAFACLICGAIHDAVPSFKALLGSPWKVVNHVPLSHILELVRQPEETREFEAYIQAELALPPEVVSQLQMAGHFPEQGD